MLSMANGYERRMLSLWRELELVLANGDWESSRNHDIKKFWMHLHGVRDGYSKHLDQVSSGHLIRSKASLGTNLQKEEGMLL